MCLSLQRFLSSQESEIERGRGIVTERERRRQGSQELAHDEKFPLCEKEKEGGTRRERRRDGGRERGRGWDWERERERERERGISSSP